MTYIRQTWADEPATTTPINAARLTHLEDGVYNSDLAAATAQATATAAQTTANAAQITAAAAIPASQKGAVSGVASLDTGGKVPSAQLPAGLGAVASVDGRTGTVTLSDLYIPLTQKGAVSGVATLDGTGKVPSAQIPGGGGGGAVSSVAGRTGAVVLSITDITNGASLQDVQESQDASDSSAQNKIDAAVLTVTSYIRENPAGSGTYSQRATVRPNGDGMVVWHGQVSPAVNATYMHELDVFWLIPT